MSDPGFDDPLSEADLLDPHFEKPSLDLLKKIAEQMEQAVIGLQAAVDQLGLIAKLTAADRETEAIGSNGRKLQGISRIKG